MKLSTVIALLGLVLLPLSGFAEKEVGNGGGGVAKNGTYMTFYSAGLYVEPMAPAEVPVRLPAIQKLTQYFTSIQYLSLRSKNPFLMAIQPTTKRQYMIATPELLTPVIKDRLLAEFQRVTGVDPANLTLFAITDTQQKITYILPGFDKLSLNDQMTILFHEAYWILHPRASYNEVVKAEMAFEAALAEPSNMAAVYDFVGYLGDSQETLAAKMTWELSSGNLRGFVNKRGQFTLGQLFGADYLACIQSLNGRRSSDNPYPFGAGNDKFGLLSSNELCAPYFRAHLNDLIVQYPRSMMLRDIANTFDNSRPVITFDHVPNLVNYHSKLFGGNYGEYGCFNENEVMRSQNDLDWSRRNVNFDWDMASLASCVVTVGADHLNTYCGSYSLSAAGSLYGNVAVPEPAYQCVGKGLSIHTEL
jgi:hypothetical protein